MESTKRSNGGLGKWVAGNMSLYANYNNTTSSNTLKEEELAFNVNSRTNIILSDDPPKSVERKVRDVLLHMGAILGRLKNILVMILTPLLCLPFLTMGKPEFNCAFCVVIMAVYWMAEVMPLAVTALLPVALFPLVGVMTCKEVAKEYINDTNFLFIGGLIVAVAVEKCGLHSRIALFVLNHVGSKPKWIMLGFMTVTALLSMFISNTATTAMMVPIGRSIIKQLIDGSSGGSLLDSNIGKKEKILKNANPSQKSMAKGLLLSICFAANIGGTGTITGTPPNLVMLGQIETLFSKADTGVSYLSFSMFALPIMFICLFACWAILVAVFLRKPPTMSEEVVKSMRDAYKTMPKMCFAEKMVMSSFLLLLALWIGREPGFMPGITSVIPKEYFTDATSAIGISLLLFALPAEWPTLSALIAPPPKPRSDRNSANVEQNESTEEVQQWTNGRLMDWDAMRDKFPWSVVLLLGGGFALAAGVKESGLSNVIGDQLAQMSDFGVSWKQALCLGLTMIITNICSNTVTASIFIPIVASIAQETGLNPLALMLPTTLACSFAFILPVGTPPNAIVFGAGDVKVSDMMLAGTLTTIATGILVVLYMMVMSPFMFALNEFPEWAALPNGTITL